MRIENMQHHYQIDWNQNIKLQTVHPIRYDGAETAS